MCIPTLPCCTTCGSTTATIRYWMFNRNAEPQCTCTDCDDAYQRALVLLYGACTTCCECGQSLPLEHIARGFTVCATCSNTPEMEVCQECRIYQPCWEMTPGFWMCDTCADSPPNNSNDLLDNESEVLF